MAQIFNIQWEYRIVHEGVINEEIINKLGKEGLELVAMHYSNLYFKRPYIDTDKPYKN